MQCSNTDALHILFVFCILNTQDSSHRGLNINTCYEWHMSGSNSSLEVFCVTIIDTVEDNKTLYLPQLCI